MQHPELYSSEERFHRPLKLKGLPHTPVGGRLDGKSCRIISCMPPNSCPPERWSRGWHEVSSPPLRELQGKAVLRFLLSRSTASPYPPNALQQPSVRKFVPSSILRFTQSICVWETGLEEDKVIRRNLLTGSSESLESLGFKERGLLRWTRCAGLHLQQHWEAWPGEAGVCKMEREPVLSPGQVSPQGI